MSCEGCFGTQKAIEQELQNTIVKAKKHAIEKDKTIFIYALPGGEFAFMEEEPARQEGIIPLQIVSNVQ